VTDRNHSLHRPSSPPESQEIKNTLNFPSTTSLRRGRHLIDELNEGSNRPRSTTKVREEIVRVTHMLKGISKRSVQHGKRDDSTSRKMLLIRAKAPAEHRRPYQRDRRGAPNIAYPARGWAEGSGLKHPTLRREPSTLLTDDDLTAGDTRGVPHLDFTRAFTPPPKRKVSRRRRL